jgi:hypothetical protein
VLINTNLANISQAINPKKGNSMRTSVKASLTALTASLLLAAASAGASTIDFEGLAGPGAQTNMNALGVNTTYMGNNWHASGSGLWGVCDGNCFGDQPLTAHSGTAYAWTWAGPQSMFIDFGTAVNFGGGYFAGQFDNRGGFNSHSIEFFAYDATHTLIGSTSAVAIADSQWSFVGANLNNVSFLEIRSDRNSWFAMDDLQIDTNRVPEPASIALLGLGLAGVALSRRRKRA